MGTPPTRRPTQCEPSGLGVAKLESDPCAGTRSVTVPRTLLSVRAALACVGLLALFACSGERESSDSYRAAVVDVEAAMSPSVSTWVSGVVSEFREQLLKAGTFNPDGVRDNMRLDAEKVGAAGCSALAEHKSALKEDQKGSDIPRVREYPLVELARAIGREPAQLYAMKLSWPDPWLLKEGIQPDYTTPFADQGFLAKYLKPELVASDGSVVFPAAGSPEYANFLGWLYEGKTIAAHTSVLSASIQDQIDACSKASR